MLWSLAVALLALGVAYLTRGTLPTGAWLGAFGALALLLAFAVGAVTGREEISHPSRAQGEENALAILAFLLAVLVPAVVMAVWFRLPVGPQRLSTLIGAAALFEVYRLGNTVAHHLLASPR